MKKMTTRFLDIVKDEQGRSWFFDNENQFIGYMCDDFKNVFPVRKLSEDIDECDFFSNNIYLCGDVMYITSYCSVDILCYDMKDNFFKKYCAGQGDKDIYFTVLFNEEIIYIPRIITNRIYLYDVKEKSFYSKTWTVHRLVQSGKLSYVCKKENKVYLVVRDTNSVVCLNLDDFSAEQMLLKEGMSLCSMLVDDDGMWFTQSNSEIIVHYKDGCYQYYNTDLQSGKVATPFWALLKNDNVLVALANKAEYVVVLNKETGEIKKAKVPKEVNVNNKRSFFRSFYIKNSKVLLFPWGMDVICELDVDEGVFYWHNQEMSLVDYYNVLRGRYICEVTEEDMEEFCEFVGAFDDMGSDNAVFGRIGNAIYEYIRI